MPAQGRGANIDTSRRASSVNRTASRRVTAQGDRDPEILQRKNAAFGPKPSPETGINERTRRLTKEQYRVKTNSGDLGSEWRGQERSYRPVQPSGGVEAPHTAPFSPSRRTGPFERGQRRS